MPILRGAYERLYLELYGLIRPELGKPCNIFSADKSLVGVLSWYGTKKMLGMPNQMVEATH